MRSTPSVLSCASLKRLRYTKPLVWAGTLAGLAYGFWAWGTLFLFGLDPQHQLGLEVSRGFTMMPLYLPSFLGLYLLNHGFADKDSWVGGLLAGYAVVIIILVNAGERAHGAVLLKGTMSGLALPICTVLTALLAWRIHVGWSKRRRETRPIRSRSARDYKGSLPS